MRNRRWLEIAEYVSLFGAVAGLIAAAASQQLIYIAAPLTLSMGLHLVNRYRWDQQTRQRERATITRVQQQLLQEFQSLRQQTVSQSVQVELNGVKETMIAVQANIQRYLAPLEKLGLKSSAVLIPNQIETSRHSGTDESSPCIPTVQTPESELILGRHCSREVLMAALEEAQERLIIVCPWLTPLGISQQEVQKFKALLERNVQIDIGWGRWLDLKNSLTDHYFWYGVLSSLQQLSQSYSDKFRIKALGTNEKFLVCDRKFAWLGSCNLLTVDDQSQEGEAGIRTTDLRIIQSLIDHFESSREIEVQAGAGGFGKPQSEREEIIGMMREVGLSEEEFNVIFEQIVKDTPVADEENLPQANEDINAFLDTLLE